MVDYTKFLCKRVLRRKSNFVIILLSLLIICIFLVMNIKTQDEFTSRIESQIQTNMEYIKSNEAQMAELIVGSDEYLSYQDSIQAAKNSIKMNKETLASIDKKDWTAVYDSYSKILEEQILMAENGERLSDGKLEVSLSSGIKKELVYIKYLQKHHLTYELPDLPIAGLSFTTSISRIFLPILIAVCCIYIVVQLYTLDYIKDQDISILYPMNKKKKILIKILIGIVLSVLLYAFLIGFSFLLATLFTGESGFDYPLMLQDNGTWNTISMVSFFKDWFMLGVLFSICLSVFIYILSLFIREDMYLLLIVTAIVLGLYYLPNVVGQVQMFAQYLPTTYMSYVDAANGALASRFSNTDITALTGVRALIICIIAQLGFCCILYGVEKSRSLKR